MPGSPVTFVGPGSTEGLDFKPADPGAELGVDLAGLPDLDPTFPLVGGLANLAHAIARRYQTPRGWLEDAPDYGSDLRLYLNDALASGSGNELAAVAEAEAEKDERILRASATATVNSSTSSVALRVALTCTFGPFALVLSVTSLSVSLLAVENG